ncbi:hypothetical protein FSP39_008518 [Pinctada imbricata]|uniref:Nucleoporin Nup43 n=1 Tax=Pinctada imbricata TaxID=66713 RepID=A0AA89C2W3_PINIB|nr:hypothetical protein FSP39_008518 [Pinctada imbricata]
MADVRVSYVSQKINKVKWRQSKRQLSQDNQSFVTGSWDDEQNKVCLWKINKDQEAKGMEEEDFGLDEGEPNILCEAPHLGDVTGLENIGDDYIIASSSCGTVTVYSHHTNSQTLGIVHQWEKLHHHNKRPCPCTCIATQDDTVITAGEDGRINMLTMGHKGPSRVIEKGDSCTINGITFLGQSQFITVNSSGQLKSFDMRVNTDEPTQTFQVTGEMTPLQSVDRHPGQPDIVATGGQDGVLGVWDLRQGKMPLSLLEAHGSTIWEVKFHRTNPDHLFTCSEDGSVWHWDGSHVEQTSAAMVTAANLTGTGAGSGGGNFTTSQLNFNTSASVNFSNPWIATDLAKNKVNVTTLTDGVMPVNCLDIDGHNLICGTDGESIISVNFKFLR